MQNKQLKRPYFPPEITAVEFRVEVGQPASGGGKSVPNEVQLTDQSDQTLGQIVSSKFISPEDFNSYYQNGMPNGNSGYFPVGGNGSDGGGYFGSTF